MLIRSVNRDTPDSHTNISHLVTISFNILNHPLALLHVP